MDHLFCCCCYRLTWVILVHNLLDLNIWKTYDHDLPPQDSSGPVSLSLAVLKTLYTPCVTLTNRSHTSSLIQAEDEHILTRIVGAPE